MRNLFRTALLIAALVGVPLTIRAHAQVAMITPVNDRQKAQFEAVTRAVVRAGYADPMMVGVSQPKDKSVPLLFAILTTKGGQGVLIITGEPDKKGTVHPVEVESGKTPTDLGVSGIAFERFLDTPDLVDVLVDHRPFQLEMSSTVQKHHVLRKQPSGMTRACDFDGTATFGYAKGPRSVQGRRTAFVEKIPGVPVSTAFQVTWIEEHTEKQGNEPASVTRSTPTVIRYQKTPARTYEPVKQ